MISPEDWLALARSQAADASAGQTELRRSVSTSYYAVFHAVARAASTLLSGGDPVRARVVHRSLTHDRLKLVSAETAKRQPRRELLPYWPSHGFGPELRIVATRVLDLQIARHQADYDPEARISAIDARTFASSAETAVAALIAAPAEETAIWLSLVIFKPFSA